MTTSAVTNITPVPTTQPPIKPKTTRSITPKQASIIKATVPVLAEHGNTITTTFYANLLTSNPDLKSVFNKTHQETGRQAHALASAVHAYAANIDNLGALSPALELICHKHASLVIKPEQYNVVGTYLLEAMKSVLGDAATPDIMDAWGAAYWQLADIMIAKEQSLYESTGKWEGWQDFKIVRKEKESEEITSFYFEAVDEALELPLFKPGQYISVNVFLEDLDGGVWQARQYSLSDSPGKRYLRISVKREPGIEVGEPKHMVHPGYLSNVLHDTKNVGDVVKLTHPFGDFYFEESDAKDPVVLISAGVGLTCLLSILKSLLESKSSRPISWIHGARNSHTRAFKEQVEKMAAENENLQTVYFASKPVGDEVEGTHYNIKGRVDLDRLPKELLFANDEHAQYFFCGPAQFMLDMETQLKSLGVSNDRIKMELFGTGGIQRAIDV